MNTVVIIIIALIIITIVDLFIKNDFMMNIFMFGLSKASKYNRDAFCRIHATGCFLAALLCTSYYYTEYSIWIILLLCDLILVYTLILLFAKKGPSITGKSLSRSVH